jgi:hypothetical protein
VVAAPLAVVAGWNEPQGAAAQATVQATWGLADTSLETVAVNETSEPTCIEAGGVGAKDTEIGMGATMVMVDEADTLGSATEVAVTFTVFPDGMADGAT